MLKSKSRQEIKIAKRLEITIRFTCKYASLIKLISYFLAGTLTESSSQFQIAI